MRTNGVVRVVEAEGITFSELDVAADYVFDRDLADSLSSA